MSDKSKLAYTPTEGVYYVVPVKSGLEVFAERADMTEENPWHMGYWIKILNHLTKEWSFTKEEKDSLKTAYMSIPRGRVQKKLDPDLKHRGEYVILHGNDVPMSVIRHRVVAEFGLGGLDSSKLQWKYDEHEVMDPEDHKLIVDIIKRHKK